MTDPTPVISAGDPQASLGVGMAALLSAIACWSLSPLLIYESKGLAPAPVVALTAVAIGSILAAIVTVRSPRLRVWTAAVRCFRGQTLWMSGVIGVGAFIAYPLLYFSAIQRGGSPILVNLVNYLWPIIGLSIVFSCRPNRRSLEIQIATGFGAAGAILAILARPTSSSGHDGIAFGLAAMGALVYGSVSAFTTLKVGSVNDRELRAQTIFLALICGGVLALALLGLIALTNPADLIPHATPSRLTSFGIYLLLLPLAHLSWFRALWDKRVPAFPAVFAVPVLATGILALAVSHQASPLVLSSLVLVLTGIAFAEFERAGLTAPVGFAVVFGAIASMLMSQAMYNRIHETLTVNNDIGVMCLVMVSLLAIFSGFILTNAIRRHDSLRDACVLFFDKLANMVRSGQTSPESAMASIGRFEEYITQSGERSTGEYEPAPPNVDDSPLASEWAKADLAVSNQTSHYEWLVLLLGSIGFVVAVQFFHSGWLTWSIFSLRAIATGFVIGVLFAIRDYDRHRPERTAELLQHLRLRYSFGSPKDNGDFVRSGREWWMVVFLGLLVGLGLLAIVLNTVP